MQRNPECFVNVLDWLGSVAAAGELRSEPRVEVRAPVTLRHAGGPASAETRDITPSGVCVSSEWAAEAGDEFTLELPTPAPNGGPTETTHSSLRCRVRHCTPVGESRFRIGAVFIGLIADGQQ